MYDSTGFSKSEITDLCVVIRPEELEPGTNHWPPILGLFRSGTVALTYIRRNRVQAELAEPMACLSLRSAARSRE
jgi:hypothetical protein